MDLLDTQIFPLIGEPGFRRLVAQFYRQVPNDGILEPMYRGRDLVAAEQRLGDFLIMRFGGPQHYLDRRGHPRLKMRHHPFAIDQAARDRWIELMEAALKETALPEPAVQVLRRFFHAAATFLINQAPADE